MYEELIKEGEFQQAIEWCDQRTRDPENPDDLSDLSISTSLIRVEVAKLMNLQKKIELSEVVDSFGETIEEHREELANTIDPDREHYLEMRIEKFLLAKTAVELIIAGAWDIHIWRREGFAAGIEFDLSQAEDPEKKKSESGEHLSLCPA